MYDRASEREKERRIDRERNRNGKWEGARLGIRKQTLAYVTLGLPQVFVNTAWARVGRLFMLNRGNFPAITDPLRSEIQSDVYEG